MIDATHVARGDPLPPLRFTTSEATPQDSNTRALSALAMVAHDFRNPLAALAVLIDAIQSAARSRDVKRLDASSKRAHRLIDHLNGVLNGVVLRTSVSGDPMQIDLHHVELGDVKRHGGRIEAGSRGVDLGAVFELHLPAPDHASTCAAHVDGDGSRGARPPARACRWAWSPRRA